MPIRTNEKEKVVSGMRIGLPKRAGSLLTPFRGLPACQLCLAPAAIALSPYGAGWAVQITNNMPD